jgi:Right handed beta helix region
MARIFLVFSIAALMGPAAYADLGAQIAAEDAKLGASPGQIQVTASGVISEGKVSLSEGHDLVCKPGVTISLEAGSYLYQNSHTGIENCIIAATSTPITGEIQSVDTEQIALKQVTFVGGGNLVFWSGVSGFTISDNTVASITALFAENQAPAAGIYLIHCSQGVVDRLKSDGFVFPPGISYTAILEINLSNNITINNPAIHHVDGSYILRGAASIDINGSTNITINGGDITHNANMDGILTQTYGTNIPSSKITIEGVNASYNGALGLNQDAPLALGDGLDIISTSHVRISHSTLNGNGNLVHDDQPGIWFFLDDDVEVSDSDISENSAAGVSSAGTPRVVLIHDTINRNQASGVYTEWQGCAATNVGSKVSFVSGPSGGFGLDWLPGTSVVLDGVTYELAQVVDSGHLTLTTSPPDHSSPVTLGINTTQNIIDSVINDNGVGQWSAQFGDQFQVGISWADGTSGTISGVTSTNKGIGAQLYGLLLTNTSSVTLYNDNFSGNLMGGDGINASHQVTTPAGLNFPDQQVGTTSAAQRIEFLSGMINAPNLVIQTSGNFSETNNCGNSASAYATCQIQITFTPTFPGPQNGTLTITDGAPGSPQTVALTGTGVIQGRGAGISSTSVSFPNQAVATTSAAQTITLWAGATVIHNLSIQTSGSFSETNTCGSSLAARATCQIQITFTPTVPGPQTGALIIADNLSSTPQTIALTGIGIAENQGISPTSISFPNQQLSTTSASETITLWAGATVIRDLLIQTSGNFSETNTCGSSLAAYATCQIHVTFTPTVVGPAHSTLTITDNAPQSPPAIFLTGTGVAGGIGLTVAMGSSNSATVAAGASATYLLSMGGSGVGGVVSLSCTGVPVDATCSLPNSKSVSASQPTTFTVSVITSAPSMGALRPTNRQHWSLLWGVAILGLMLPVRGRTGFNRRYPVRLLLLLLVLCACSGVSSNSTSDRTASGNYVLMIVARIGSTSQQIPLMLNVR